jgi:pSer/pThr/pTyr-binding forkhead associated (FHA) protein
MPKIQFIYPNGREEKFSLEGEVFTIGRAADNDIVLADQRVSSHHAVLKRSPGGEFVLNDLGATNPTRVNGMPAQLHELKNGDVVLFGDVYANYMSDRGAPPDPRQPRRPGAPGQAETPGTGCFRMLVFMISLAAAVGVVAARL